MNLRLLKRPAAVIVLAALAAATAFAKDHATITLGTAVSINGTTLQQGKYKVTWTSLSPEATVTFSRGHKTLATAEGKWVDRNRQYNTDQVLYSNDGDGTRKIIELRFAGMSQALVFGGSGSTS